MLPEFKKESATAIMNKKRSFTLRKNTKKSGVGEGGQQRRQEKGLMAKGLFTFINIF